MAPSQKEGTISKLVFMPPQDDLKRWFAARLADTLSEYEVASPETDEEAVEAIKDADAAFGWVPPAALEAAGKRIDEYRCLSLVLALVSLRAPSLSEEKRR